MPFQIDRTMRGFAVNLGPAMWSARAHMFGGNQMETLELDIVHDLFAQGPASARDDLNYRLHCLVRVDAYVYFATLVVVAWASSPCSSARCRCHGYISERNMTYTSTYPFSGCRNAPGNVPTILKPSCSQRWIADSFVETTKLNCIALKPSRRASSKECSAILRPTPCPRADDGTINAAF